MLALMDLIQLKMPPERAALVAGAIERDLEINRGSEQATELRQVLTWLRYRIDRWAAHHPGQPAT